MSWRAKWKWPWRLINFFSCKSLSFFLINFFMCTFINGLPTICLIRFVNEIPSNLTRMNKELQQKASCSCLNSKRNNLLQSKYTSELESFCCQTYWFIVLSYVVSFHLKLNFTPSDFIKHRNSINWNTHTHTLNSCSHSWLGPILWAAGSKS